ncbi:hypothetical protein [Streptomyces sp. NPDC057250]|uniref:hypothetical protein n=1 Tax=Streptomyces sp. NPDC057250 TaxID=3346068 RepID=UPI0036407AF6
MANVTMDLQDLTALVALASSRGVANRYGLMLDVYNAARVKAGKSATSDPMVVDYTPSGTLNPKLDTPPQVIARIKTAIAAAS